MNALLAKKILAALKNSKSLKSSELEQITGASSFVLKREIGEINDFLKKNQYPLEISSKRGYKNGYALRGDLKSVDITHIVQAVNKADNPYFAIISRQDTRILYIMMILLQKISGIKLQNLSDDMAISTRALNKDMVLVREFLGKFDISVNNRPHHGLFISCNEFDRQSCMHTVYKRLSDYLPGRQADELFFGADCIPIRKTIYHLCIDSFQKNRIVLSDLAIIDIASNIWINTVYHRSELSRDILQSNEPVYIEEKYTLAAEEILNSPVLAEVHIPDSFDVRSIVLRLAGQSVQENPGGADRQSIYISNRILRAIDDINGTSLSLDNEFKSEFCKLIQLIFIHKKYRIRYDYPLQYKMRYYYYPGYICASQAAGIFTRETGIVIDEVELSNLIVSFEHWFSENRQHRRVLLISASGKRNSEILASSIREMYGGYLEYLDAIPMRNKTQINEEMYDLILTTHWIALDTSLPVVEVEYFLEKRTKRKLANILSVNHQLSEQFDRHFHKDMFYTDLDIPSQAEIIKEIGRQTGREEIDADSYISDPFIRNHICLFINKKLVRQNPGFLVCVLNKPVRWDELQTQIILLETGNVHYRFKEAVIQRMNLIAEDRDLTAFIKNPSFDSFRDLMLGG